MQALFGLNGKRILVLGGGQGMGEATVRLLASLGAQVAVVDREIKRAESVVADAIANGGKATAYSIDVLNDDALISGIAHIEADSGPLDGMATVIGMAAWSPLADMDMGMWDEDQRRNLRYFFLAAREVAKSLIKRQAPGAIVCVSSVDGSRSAPSHGSYGAAKAGLSNLVKTMTVEWGPQGIRANVVAPGAIITPRIPHAGENEKLISGCIPLGRRGTVEEIAQSIVFLLSDMAQYISGQTLAVDGGALATSPFASAGTK
ncbi:SDR family NAD(P)-dependent oxidoreductase [Zhongshania sp.]|uniref:SDR family NAD(P)-dependent oxidoreductase n=1 Tax=Zhongshania sp. TaxID=1971902 RepID=UPI003566E1E8